MNWNLSAAPGSRTRRPRAERASRLACTVALAWHLAACGGPGSGPVVIPEPRAGTEIGEAAEVPEGALFLGVRGVGLVEISNGVSTLVLPAEHPIVDMAVAPSSDLWVSTYDHGTVRIRDGKVEVTSATDRYTHFGFRGDGEVWAVSDSIDWEVARWDGSAWTKVRSRADFAGFYEDNKLNDMAVTKDGVWVSSWNGFSRLRDGAWEPVALPAALGTPDPDAPVERAPWQLTGSGEGLIVRFIGGYHVLSRGVYRPFSWPADAAVDAINASGLAAGHEVRSGKLTVGGPALGWTSKPVPSPAVGALQDMAVDDRGRIWLAGEEALAVIDARGEVLSLWGPGTLAGVTGAIDNVALLGGGPRELPAKQPVSTWTLTGKVEIYKSGAPLAGAKVVLCAGYGDCSKGTFSRSAVTGADGAYRLTGVPPGDFRVRAEVPDGTPGCDGLFRESWGTTISVGRACHAAEGAPRECAVGPMHVCQPFEMPPPP